MGASSVVSGFKFESYKIDHVKLKAVQSSQMLAYKGVIPAEEWVFDLQIRNPLRWKSESAYICGVDVKVSVLTAKGRECHDNGAAVDDKEVLIELIAGIAGIFKADEGSFSGDAEEGLVKVQAPALLLAHLRGAVSSLLANAGYGVYLLPLINIQETAKRALAEVEIQDIEENKLSPASALFQCK